MHKITGMLLINVPQISLRISQDAVPVAVLPAYIYIYIYGWRCGLLLHPVSGGCVQPRLRLNTWIWEGGFQGAMIIHCVKINLQSPVPTLLTEIELKGTQTIFDPKARQHDFWITALRQVSTFGPSGTGTQYVRRGLMVKCQAWCALYV